jgi:hypothetical protein
MQRFSRKPGTTLCKHCGEDFKNHGEANECFTSSVDDVNSQSTTVIKACNGDRSQNLFNIALEIENLCAGINNIAAHKLCGLAEQLKIIAEEIKRKPLPLGIRNDIEEQIPVDTQVETLSLREALDAFLIENGIMGYTDSIINIFEAKR